MNWVTGGDLEGDSSIRHIHLALHILQPLQP